MHKKPPIAGRGAASNTPNRFEKVRLDGEPIDSPAPSDDEGVQSGDRARPKLRTEYLIDHSRTIITKNDSPDIPFVYGVNPYRGCEHGCIYCYARPTHEYLGMSAGLDFESRILVKTEAPKLLREALFKSSWAPAPITMSGVTDCYQPIERKLKITRGCLEVLAEFKNPFLLISKNHLITRDLDLIAPMARLGAARVFVTITTLDPELCAILEPRTSRPAFRLEALRELSAAGVPAGVMIAPVIPGLTDHEMPSILRAAAEAGAKSASYVPLRLPFAVAPLFEEWLGIHYPERKDKILNLLRSMKGGRLNDPNFGSRMRGQGPFAEQIRSLFHLYCRREGLNQESVELSTEHFRRPPKSGDQLALF